MSVPSQKLFLFKRNNGIYYIGFYLNGKKRWKSTGCRSKSDAHLSLRNYEQMLLPKSPEITLCQFEKEILDYALNTFAYRTYLIYSINLRHFRKLVGDIPILTITPKHLDDFKVHRIRNGIKPVTINIGLRCLRAAFNTAIRWKYIATNPTTGVKSVQVPDTMPTFFSREDFQKLISCIKETWLKELVILAVLTGMRRGELINLEWRHVDLARKLITIESGPTFRTKQGKRRVIPLSDVACHLLQLRWQMQGGEYVFTLNNRKVLDNWVTNKFKYYVYKCRLPNDKLHFHSLRHTFASWLVQDGVNLYEIQKLLGHSNITVTQVYSHLLPETLHSTVNRLKISVN